MAGTWVLPVRCCTAQAEPEESRTRALCPNSSPIALLGHSRCAGQRVRAVLPTSDSPKHEEEQQKANPFSQGATFVAVSFGFPQNPPL